MGSLDDPTARLDTSFLLQGLGFFAPAANMCSKSELQYHVANFVVIKAFIQT